MRRPGFSTILSDAWALWRADWSTLTAMAGPFLFLPPLAIHLLLSPALDRALAGIAPDDTAARFQAFSGWVTASLPWLAVAQAVVQFGGLLILLFYLDRGRPAVGVALRTAARTFPVYLLAMILVSLVAFGGLLVLIVGYAYALARLAMVGPVIAAEREGNPFAAIGRSIALTRGSGLVLMGILILLYCANIVVEAPFDQIEEWMTTHAPNPVAAAIVGMAIAAVTAATLLATTLVQVAAYRRFTSTRAALTDTFV